MLSQTMGISLSLKIYDSLFEFNPGRDRSIVKALGRAFDKCNRMKSKKIFHTGINQLKKI